MEVGIDILDTARMEHLTDKKTFLNKFFSQKEIDYIESVPQSSKAVVMAGYYSCKEAFLKACGIGIGRGIDLKDICIDYTDLGRPIITLTGKANLKFKELGYNYITCSISDSNNITVAICIVY